jgi:hypothetical protein
VPLHLAAESHGSTMHNAGENLNINSGKNFPLHFAPGSQIAELENVAENKSWRGESSKKFW